MCRINLSLQEKLVDSLAVAGTASCDVWLRVVTIVRLEDGVEGGALERQLGSS